MLEQRVQTIMRYVPVEIHDLWQLLDGYLEHNWAQFQEEICEIYEEGDLLSRYSKQKLADYTRQASHSQKKDKEDVGKYYQRFLILSKPLLQSQRLTEDE